MFTFFLFRRLPCIYQSIRAIIAYNLLHIQRSDSLLYLLVFFSHSTVSFNYFSCPSYSYINEMVQKYDVGLHDRNSKLQILNTDNHRKQVNRYTHRQKKGEKKLYNVKKLQSSEVSSLIYELITFVFVFVQVRDACVFEQ